MSHRIYYEVQPDSPVVGAIREAEDRQCAFLDAIAVIKEEFGAEAIWTWEGSRFSGVQFRGDPPKGWRRKEQYAVPDKRCKEGRALAKRFSELPVGVDGFAFSSILSKVAGGDVLYWSNHHVHFATYEVLTKVIVLSLAAGCTVVPPGCRELKMSEYWALREAHEVKSEPVAV